jgi:hypothetical protein
LSEFEDPVATLLRLINSRIRITKDNGSGAKILATEQAYDREILLKEYDAQITLAVDPNFGVQDQRLNLSGTLRRKVYFLKCTSHSIDRPSLPGSDAGRVMRNKVASQINAIIRENRTQPHQTVYNFAGIGYPTGDPHKAFAAAAPSELAPSNPTWAELSNLEYQGIWYSDENRYSKSASTADQFSMMLFRFKIGSRAQCVKKIVLSFEGYGTSSNGNVGVSVGVWNHASSAWEQNQSGSSGEDETLTITISENWTNFIDSNGYIWFLARTTNPSDGFALATLNCNFVQCTVNVNGITYCDVVNHKPVDIVDVKPFLFKTEFTLKGWLFETII